MANVSMHEAKSNLSKLVERVEGGEEIVITRRGAPAARLVPVQQGAGFASLAGAWRGRVRIADDFYEPPDDVESLALVTADGTWPNTESNWCGIDEERLARHDDDTPPAARSELFRSDYVDAGADSGDRG